MADWSRLHQELAITNRHIAEAQARMKRQSEVARKLDASGQDTAAAQELLRVLQQSLDAMLGRREQIVRELSRGSQPAAGRRPAGGGGKPPGQENRRLS
jgi:hypothetical protein